MLRTDKVRRLIPISGKDSLCTVIVQMKKEPQHEYEFVFCDVGMELPETMEWMDRVEKSLNIKITRIGKNLERVIAIAGMLPSFARRFCTKTAKIEPIKEFMDSGGGKVIQYIGFRADEKDRIPPPGVERAIAETRYPLIEEGIDVAGVYRILDQYKDVAPPSFFWRRLYDEVISTVGHQSRKFIENAKPWTMNYLFSWRSRSNCYSCFNQRLYEWVGLLEHHPHLYQQAEEMESAYGGKGSAFRLERTEEKITQQADFWWNPNYSLPHLRLRAEEIFKDRVEAVRKLTIESRHKPLEMVDRLSSTSCGALCGK